MDEQNRNLLLATVLSIVVIVVWYALFPPPEPEVQSDPADVATTPAAQEDALTPEVGETGGVATQTAESQTTASEVEAAPRVAIQSDRLQGSLSLAGGRIDELTLLDYTNSLRADSQTVQLLSPVGQSRPYYALYGWAPASGLSAEQVPGPMTLWQLTSEGDLTPDNPVVLQWQNDTGQVFTREITLDEDYLFTIRQSVTNNGDAAIRLAPYGILARHGLPEDLKNFFILHEGVVGLTDNTLHEIDYDNMPDFDRDPQRGVPSESFSVEENGWIGFTDHYWMTTLLPEPGQAFTASARYLPRADIYQTEALLPAMDVAPGETVDVTTSLFAGAKEWDAIRNYEAGREVKGFGPSISFGFGLADRDGFKDYLDSIDWGWFFFLTKPIFWVLHELNILIGNMGWAIVALTIVLKIILFPLAYKSYASMARMRELQPEMEALKERVGDDRQKMQQEMLKLYRDKKVNPAAGCLPILMQIPIFFSLYKVIFVTIELRHAPWVGWIKDLSAPDPSSIMNLWGLLPFAGPEPGSILALIFIGIMPLALGVSMWLQQKLNPQPTDPTQAMIFAWMPWVFMFMLGSFASGLVLYWITNNLITFAQQYLIMRSHGYTPDLFGNIMGSFKRKPKE